MTPARKLTAIALVIAFIQFTNALEYMVFNPIFIYMAGDFSVPVSFAGYVSAAYTLAAVISGIGAFFWIGGVEKRRFLMLNVTLLGVTTLLIATTQQFYWLLALRLLAGLLGGTTMGVGIGLLLNAAPAALHGRMLATVIASFSLVSIVGMPGMLYLCEVASWRAALAAIGGLCLLAAVLVALFVPKDAPQPQAAAPVTLDRRLLLFASAAGLTQFSPMLLIGAGAAAHPAATGGRRAFVLAVSHRRRGRLSGDRAGGPLAATRWRRDADGGRHAVAAGQPVAGGARWRSR